jgi:hypothetical protein
MDHVPNVDDVTRLCQLEVQLDSDFWLLCAISLSGLSIPFLYFFKCEFICKYTILIHTEEFVR